VQNIKWREEVDIESIFHQNPLPEEIRDEFSYEFTGKNKLGGPGTKQH
jgi:hypothetical protein